jgi:hypothetical protein
VYLIVLVTILSEGITTSHCGAIVWDRVEGSHACGSKNFSSKLNEARSDG